MKEENKLTANEFNAIQNWHKHLIKQTAKRKTKRIMGKKTKLAQRNKK